MSFKEIFYHESDIRQIKKHTFLITCIYFIVVLIGMFHHEVWRDELHAWLIVTNSNSLADIYNNIRYDGHPMLWHIFLYPLSKITKDPIIMQSFHILIATGSVYLFNRFSNFSFFIKFLFTFGYYSIFEYSLVARCYSLGFFLIILFCVLYSCRQKNILWISLVLFLLANTSAHGIVIVPSFTALLVFDFYFNRQTVEWKQVSFYKIILAVFIIFTGFLLSYLQIRPEPDNINQACYGCLLKANRMSHVFSKIYDSYFLIPEMINLPKWDTTGLLGYNPNLSHVLSIVLSLLTIFFSTIIILKKPFALFLYITATFSLICLFGLTDFTAPRYMGHLFMIFIAANWISHNYGGFEYKNNAIQFFSNYGNKFRSGFIIIVLSSQFICGVAIYMTDYFMSFSMSTAAAKYVREEQLDTLTIVGAKDANVSPFAAFLRKPIFYPQRNQFGTFIIFDNKRERQVNFEKVLSSIDSLLTPNNQKILVIFNPEAENFYKQTMKSIGKERFLNTIELKYLNKFENSMVGSEDYYLYLASRIIK